MTQQDQILATTATVSPSFESWSPLPEEIKLMVLSCIVGNISERNSRVSIISNCNHMNVFNEYMRPLLACQNGELFRLAKVAYYNNNTYEISIEENEHENFYRPLTFRCPHPNIARMIRHLSVTIGAYTINTLQLEDLLLDSLQPLHLLLQATRPLDLTVLDPSVLNSSAQNWLLATPRDNSWQTSFTNLHTLKLSLHLFDWNDVEKDDQECCISPGLMEATRKCLADTKTLFRAKEVETELLLECYDGEESVYCYEHADLVEHWKLLATK